MIVCKYCFQALRSRGEANLHSNVTEDKLKELNRPITEDGYDLLSECEWCGDDTLIEELKEVN